MSYRNLLVHVDNTGEAKTRVAAAAAFATRWASTLTGVFLRSEVVPNYMIGDGVIALPAEYVDQFVREREVETGKAVAAARFVFENAAREARNPFYWLDINGDNDAQLVACARRHDLTILPGVMKPAFGDNRLTAAQIAMACGGPVLVLPRAGYPAAFGRRILVAWKESREAARVLRDAWPFLSAADEVVFLTVDRHAANELDGLLVRHLEAHGCKSSRLVVDRDDDASTAEYIRRHIDMVGADMVVLGLYGHSRVREFVLGGVSRDLMNSLPMPLLVSH